MSQEYIPLTHDLMIGVEDQLQRGIPLESILIKLSKKLYLYLKEEMQSSSAGGDVVRWNGRTVMGIPVEIDPGLAEDYFEVTANDFYLENPRLPGF